MLNALRSQLRFASVPAPKAVPAASDRFETTRARPLPRTRKPDIPAATAPTLPSTLPQRARTEPHLENRANAWTVLCDVARELAYSLRDAYATCRKHGILAAVRMFSSHMAQLFVGTSAFFIFNMARRIHGFWQWLHGGVKTG